MTVVGIGYWEAVNAQGFGAWRASSKSRLL